MVLSPKPKTTIREVGCIDDKTKRKIIAYLKKKVNKWIRDNPGVPFAARNLVGNRKEYWKGLELQKLYESRRKQYNNHKKAFSQAGRDAGWLLKKLLNEDTRKFRIIKKDVSYYKPL